MSASAKQLGPAGQKVALAVTCLVFISVGLALWIPMFLLPVLDWSRMKKWREAPCTILQGPGGSGETFSTELRYRYEYDGETYESSNPGFTEFVGFAVWTVKPGTAAVCYVNPRAPREAVLNRSLDPEIFVWCAPLFFVFFPLVALVLGVRNIGRPREPELPTDSVVLAPRRGTGCGLAIQFGMLLFLGGTIALLVAIPGFRETILARLIYLAPLGLATFFILLGMVRTFLGLFTPRVTLTVSPGSAAPGLTVEVRWAATGPWERVKNFRITLEGREETRMSRKGEVRKSPLAAIDVAKGGPKDLRRGSAKVKIPAGSMPSFVHGGRSIVWVFRVACDASTPDAGDEHVYTIAFRKGAGS